MYFNYTIKADTDEPIMLLNKHIGFDEEDGMGIDGSLFQAELLALDLLGKKRIQIWINSPGGVVMDGYNIYNAILKSKTKVDTYCVGIAGSISAVIFQAGRKRVMADYSLLMYHNPFGGESDTLSNMKASLVKMISTRTGTSEDSVASIMDRTTWMSASESLEAGFCDEVENSSLQNKKHGSLSGEDIKSMAPKAYWNEANKILNSVLNPTTDMKKVANKLGLNPEASEESIIAGVEALQTKVTATETQLGNVRNELTSEQAKVVELTKQVNEFKQKAIEAENATKKLNAKNMVEGFAAQGRIKADDAAIVNKWIAKAEADFEGTKELLETLPITKVANKIPAPGDGGNNEALLTNVIGSTMADIRNRMEKQN